jgi:hypothetical protein
MNGNEPSAMRSLDEAELDYVSGGACNCGNGANCVTKKTSGGTTTSTNCSGTVVFIWVD